MRCMLPQDRPTPWNGILPYGETVAADAATMPASEIAEMGQVIHDSGKRLERLIENFLIYAQIELLGTDPQKVAALRKKRTLQAASLIEDRSRAQANLAMRPADLKLELTNIEAPVSEDYLTKIVDELVQNAFKFSQSETPVRVVLSDSPGAVLLSVEDRGRGFSTDHISRVGAYMQFERNILEQQGLGLGLTIAKRLTELHGGTLAIQSNKREVTTISVRLPKSEPLA